MALSSDEITALQTFLANGGADLPAKVAKLEKNTGLAEDESESDGEAPETPTDTMTIGGIGYKFTAPTFRYNGTLYISADVVASNTANNAIKTALVAQQTTGGVFYPGILKKA